MGGAGAESAFHGGRVPVLPETLAFTRLLETDGGNGCKTMGVHLMPPNCPLKRVKLVSFLLRVDFTTVGKKKKNLKRIKFSETLKRLEPFHFNSIFKFHSVQTTPFL